MSYASILSDIPADEKQKFMLYLSALNGVQISKKEEELGKLVKFSREFDQSMKELAGVSDPLEEFLARYRSVMYRIDNIAEFAGNPDLDEDIFVDAASSEIYELIDLVDALKNGLDAARSMICRYETVREIERSVRSASNIIASDMGF